MIFALLGFPWYGWTFVLSLFGLLYWSVLVSRRGLAAQGGDDGPLRFPVDPKVKASDQDLRDLSIGAFLSGMWGFPINTVGTGADPGAVRSVLAEAWSVKSKAEAQSTVRWLLDGGHRESFDAVLRVAGPDPSRAAKERLEEAFGGGAAVELAEPLQNFVETHAELSRRGYIETEADLDRGTSAWDYSRAVTVARFGHTAGFLTDDEAWGFVREAGALARDEFSSWREFLKSYVIGRAVWNGMSQLEDPHVTRIIKDVTEAPDSPWQAVSWS